MRDLWGTIDATRLALGLAGLGIGGFVAYLFAQQPSNFQGGTVIFGGRTGGVRVVYAAAFCWEDEQTVRVVGGPT